MISFMIISQSRQTKENECIILRQQIITYKPIKSKKKLIPESNTSRKKLLKAYNISLQLPSNNYTLKKKYTKNFLIDSYNVLIKRQVPSMLKLLLLLHTNSNSPRRDDDHLHNLLLGSNNRKRTTLHTTLPPIPPQLSELPEPPRHQIRKAQINRIAIAEGNRVETW